MKTRHLANRHTSANRQTGVSHIGTGHRHFSFLCILFVGKHIMEEGGMAAQAAVPSHLFHQRRVLPPTQWRAPGAAHSRVAKAFNAEPSAGRS